MTAAAEAPAGGSGNLAGSRIRSRATTAPSVVRQAVAIFILAVALSRAVWRYGLTVANGGDPWMTGDWFINYADGFVRRGLFGELILRLFPPGQGGLWLLFALQVSLYAVVVAYLVTVLHRHRYSWSSVALVCGPAGITFIGWDTDGGFRKEILVFAALALLAWARRVRGAGRPGLITGALALFTLAVFSWETGALLLPAILCLLLADPRGRDALSWSAASLFSAVAVVGGVAGSLAHGDEGTANLVCHAVRERGFLGPSLCGAADLGGGGIEAIGWSSTRAFSDVAASFPLYIGYLPLIALALVPVVVSPWLRRHAGWVLAITAGVLPLYVLVTDYGRWTHVLVLALTFCMTAGTTDDIASTLWNPVSTILYVTMWGMPHHLPPDSGFGWYGLASSLVHGSIGWVSDYLGFPVAPGVSAGGG